MRFFGAGGKMGFGNKYDEIFLGGEFSSSNFGNEVNFISGKIFKKTPSNKFETFGLGLDVSVFTQVYALAVDSNGNLYAGGAFTTVNGASATVANRIAKWDGTSWSSLGSGLNNSCSSLALDSNGNVYAGGQFTTAGGNTANRIAVWYPNNSTWEALGDGLNNTCRGLAFDSNGNLYAGGFFTTAGGNAANRIAVWYPNNSTWEALGSGIAGGNFNFPSLYDLAFDSNDNLYVGGNFSTIDGNSIEDIAVLYSSNNTWSSLGTGIGFSDDHSSFKFVDCFAIDSNDNLYVGGFFGTAGGISSKCIAFWNSSNNTWESVGNGVDLKTFANTYVRDLLIDSNDNLYVTGRFNIAYQTNKEFLAFTRAFRGKIFQEPNS